MSRRRLSIFLILVGIFGAAGILIVRPSPEFIEHSYVNAGYAVWQHAASSLTLLVPFSISDIIKVGFIALAIYIVFAGWRNSLRVRISEGPASKMNARIKRHFRVLGSTVAKLLALAGYAVMWFELGWGLNYARAPVEVRLEYRADAVTAASMNALRVRAMRELNRLAPAAHAMEKRSEKDGTPEFNLADLQGVWLPVVQRFGDTWMPHVGPGKFSITDPFMVATGTSGFVSPFTLEVQMASDVLWFEKPFDLAHEWTHVAGFAREDEANYAAALACTRSKNPLIAYSGWFAVFLQIPPLPRYEPKMFDREVWNDFYVLRDRNASRINARFAKLSWRAYNAYLKSNRVHGGVDNYNEVLRLLLAIPLDGNGLPLAAKS